MSDRIKLMNVNITRNYEIDQSESGVNHGRLTVSIHGIISTIVRILQSQATRIIQTNNQQLIPSFNPFRNYIDLHVPIVGELGLVMTTVFIRLAAHEWTIHHLVNRSIESQWLSARSLGQLLDRIQYGQSDDHEFESNPFFHFSDIQNFFTHQLCIPSSSLINLWPNLCSGLLRASLTIPLLNFNYPSATLSIIPSVPISSIVPLAVTKIQCTLAPLSIHCPMTNPIDPTVIRIPYSQNFMKLFLYILEQQCNKSITLPVNFWNTLSQTICSNISFDEIESQQNSDPLILCFKEVINSIESEMKSWNEFIGDSTAVNGNTNHQQTKFNSSFRRLVNFSIDLFQIVSRSI